MHGRGIDDNELITRYKVDPIMGGTGMNVNFVTFLRERLRSRRGGRHEQRVKRYAMVVDTRTCVGCAACVIACKTENDVAEGFSRDWIFTETSGTFPNLEMEIRSERCNHCEDAPCVSVCPTGASHYGPGGTVLVNRAKCTGCKACIAACPYDARFIDPRTGCDRQVHLLRAPGRERDADDGVPGSLSHEEHLLRGPERSRERSLPAAEDAAGVRAPARRRHPSQALLPEVI